MRCGTCSALTYTYVMFARLAVALRGTEGDLNRHRWLLRQGASTPCSLGRSPTAPASWPCCRDGSWLTRRLRERGTFNEPRA